MKFELFDYVEFYSTSTIKRNGIITHKFKTVQELLDYYNIDLKKLKAMTYKFTSKQLVEPIYTIHAEKPEPKVYVYFVAEDLITRKLESITLDKLY